MYVSVFLMVCYCLGAGFYSPVHKFLNRILDFIKYGAYYVTYIFLFISNYLINLQFWAGFYSHVHEFLNIFWLNIKYGA